jgi:hypothetical protein
LVDNCNNPITQYNVEDVFRALIRRIISLQNLIKTLNTTVTNQTSQINTHTAEIANIVANCCNITLVSQIQTLNARLAAAGIP